MELGLVAVAGIHCGRFIVADGLEPQHFQKLIAAVVVHEGVAGVGVLHYIVGDEGTIKSLCKLIGYLLASGFNLFS